MKNIIISTDYFKSDYSNKEKFIEILQRNNDKFLYFIVTKNAYKGSQIIEELKNNYNLNCRFLPRNSELISNYLDFEVIIGNKDVDFYTATNNKKIIFYDKDFSAEKKVLQYGFEFSIDILDKLLKIIDLDKSHYCELISNNSAIKLFSLINARYRVNSNYSIDEKLLIEDFERFIKKNASVKNKELITYYIILAILKLDIIVPDLIFYFPSSKIEPNPFMDNLVKKLRNIFHLSINTPELLKRSREITPSKNLSYDERIGCQRHLNSISFNNSIDIKSKNILVLDDYCTNGTSFETVRNFIIAKNEPIGSLTFISIGNFGKDYILQDYEIVNDKLEWKRYPIEYNYNPNYQETLDKLTQILNEDE